jgi:hypothetical protein
MYSTLQRYSYSFLFIILEGFIWVLLQNFTETPHKKEPPIEDDVRPAESKLAAVQKVVSDDTLCFASSAPSSDGVADPQEGSAV